MPPKTICTIALLSCCCCLRTSAQQSGQRSDSTSPSKYCNPANSSPTPKIDAAANSHTPPNNTRYLVITLLSGVGIQPTGNSNGGLLNVSFPYTVNGTGDSIFHSHNARPYSHAKVFILPVGFELGGLHQYFNTSISFPVIGQFTDGYNFSIGYGYNFYLNGRHTNPTEGKGFVIKPSISLSLTYDAGDNRDAGLGKLDNNNKSINAFGKSSGSNFSVTTVDYIFADITTGSTHTYNTKTLDVGYLQHEFSLMPRISISNNQYSKCKGPHWELSVGYNIPIADWGGIAFTQDDGNSHNNALDGSVGVGHSGLTTTYNGRPVTSTPFRFSGLSFNFALSLLAFRHKGS